MIAFGPAGARQLGLAKGGCRMARRVAPHRSSARRRLGCRPAAGVRGPVGSCVTREPLVLPEAHRAEADAASYTPQFITRNPVPCHL